MTTPTPVNLPLEEDAERLAKLPRWARQRIHQLATDLADAREQLDAGPDDSDTFADPYAEGNHIGRPLGKGTRIRFANQEDRDRFGSRVFIDVKYDADAKVLEVYASDAIALAPVSSNVVKIRLVG